MKCMTCKRKLKKGADNPCKKCQKGFFCKTCGTYHEFTAYVYAHTRDILTHHCDCGAEHQIIMLHATQTKEGSP